jgi:glycerophosphoryl diester phosphodiesterase
MLRLVLPQWFVCGWFSFGVAALPAQIPTPPLLERLRAAARDGMLVAGHRGASADHPENTAAAFRAAAAAGAQFVEFDVHQTRDGAWVVLHDATCDRTTDAVARYGRKGVRIAELDLAEVRTLDAGRWFAPACAGERIPTLAEALAAAAPAVPMVEQKGGDAAALAAALQQLGAQDRVVVQSFDWAWLQEFHRAAPQVVVGALGTGELDAERLAALPVTGARFVHWDHRTLTVAAAAAVQRGGWLLGVYTVDPELTMAGAARFGCDFVTTNRPAQAVALRALGWFARPLPAVRPTGPASSDR